VIETTSFRVWGVRDTGQAGEESPVRFHQSGTKRCHRPLAGDFTLDLDYGRVRAEISTRP